MEPNPDNQGKNRDSLGRWIKGRSGNLAGRTKGKTMKEWAKEYLSRLNDEERDEFMEGIPKEKVWAMAEGNPDNRHELENINKIFSPADIEKAKEILNGRSNTTPPASE